MKLFAGIFIICALVTEASALKCFSCVSETGKCEQKEEVCKSGSKDTCLTLANTATIGKTSYFKGCGNCDESFSYDFGTTMLNLECSSCSSDLCNNQTFPENPTPNGLECYGCFDVSHKTCDSGGNIVKCVGNEDRCIEASSTPAFPQAPVNAVKGCVSKNICESAKTTHLGIPIAPNATCCEGNLCNNGTTPPASALKCFSCVSETGKCEQKEEVCKSGSKDTCVTLANTTTNGRTSYFKGCGNCAESFSYDFGSVMENLECNSCSSDLCNNQTFPGNPTPNGLECYGCFDESPEACFNSPSIVKCVGNEDRCMNGSSTPPFPHAPVKAVKGCVSKDICESAKATHLKIPFAPNPTCCQGNLCNKGTRLPASALKCFSFVSESGNPEQKEEACVPGTKHTCVTLANTTTNGKTSYFKGCGNCAESFSYNFGPVSKSLECSSCSSDLCNDQPFPGNPTPNGRECYGCFDVSHKTCDSRRNIVKCVGNEDRCIEASSTPPFPHAPVNAVKGCVSKNICESAKTTHLRIPIAPNPTCCQGNLCNKGTRLPGNGISLSLLAVVVVRTLL